MKEKEIIILDRKRIQHRITMLEAKMSGDIIRFSSWTKVAAAQCTNSEDIEDIVHTAVGALQKVRRTEGMLEALKKLQQVERKEENDTTS